MDVHNIRDLYCQYVNCEMDKCLSLESVKCTNQCVKGRQVESSHLKFNVDNAAKE